MKSECNEMSVDSPVFLWVDFRITTSIRLMLHGLKDEHSQGFVTQFFLLRFMISSPDSAYPFTKSIHCMLPVLESDDQGHFLFR